MHARNDWRIHQFRFGKLYTIKHAFFKKSSVYFLAGNSNIVEIPNESLTFEKNLPLNKIKNVFVPFSCP